MSLRTFVAMALLAPTPVLANPAPHPGEADLFATPASIATEHRELHETLERASAEPGDLGEAARALEAALGPHFKREEEIATPPLSLLEPLAHGPVTANMRQVLPMTQALERELPRMLEEHKAVAAARERFEAAARAANRPDYVAFAHGLAAHAKMEEEILYPAAILVGRYVSGRKR